MRLCMAVKKQRGEPVSLFVDFLRIWYTQPALKTMLRDPDVIHRLDLRYLERALLQAQEPSTDPKLIAIYKDLTQASANARTRDVFNLMRELETVGGNTDAAWMRFGITLIRSLHKAHEPVSQAIKTHGPTLSQTSSKPTSIALATKLYWRLRLKIAN